jgi:CubicO group peptidase (beta-lactamase class C family)
MPAPDRRLNLVAGVLWLVAFACIGGSTAAGEAPSGQDGGAALSAAQIVETLGPGPLPPRLPGARGDGERPKSGEISSRIDSCVEANRVQLGAPGAAVAVALDGEMLYQRGYGVKRRGGNDPVTPDTIFRIGSVTKQMTAAAVLQQVELGRVDLDAPVTDYVPELVIGGRWPADRIKVRHVLTHTSGFPDRINEHSVVGDQALSFWATLQTQVRLHAPPGSFWNYSNPNFMIAGLVAERASGTPYRDLLEDSLWQPAGMTDTTFNPSRVIAGGDYSFGHYFAPEDGQNHIVGPRDNDLWAAGPAGFAFSTVGDLVRWALLLTDGGGPVLSPWSAATMQDPHAWQHYTPDLYYGYGIMVDRYQGLDIRQHGGNVAGFGTYLLWVPDRRFAVALLTNVSSSLIDAAYCIVDEVLDPVPVEPPDLTTDPATWARYEGEYQLTESDGASVRARVELDGDRLIGIITNPLDPDETLTAELVQAFLDTFVFDNDGDGALDTDVTFHERDGLPGVTVWLRSRHLVGERLLDPRRAVRQLGP